MSFDTLGEAMAASIAVYFLPALDVAGQLKSLAGDGDGTRVERAVRADGKFGKLFTEAPFNLPPSTRMRYVPAVGEKLVHAGRV